MSSSSCSPDSPLSTTSSVLSILTFALGLLGFYLALVSATRSAPGEVQRLVSDLRSTQAEINRVSEWIFDSDEGSAWMKRRGGGGGGGNNVLWGTRGVKNGGQEARPAVLDMSGNHMLYDEVQGLLMTCVRLFYEADDLLKRSESEGKGLWRRVLFMVHRDEVLEKVSRLQEQKAKLAAIQLSLFLRKSAAHDAMLRRVVSFIDEFEARYNGSNDAPWFRSSNGDGKTNAEQDGGRAQRSVLTDSSYVRPGQRQDRCV